MIKGAVTTIVSASFCRRKRLLHDFTFTKKDFHTMTVNFKIETFSEASKYRDCSQCHSEQFVLMFFVCLFVVFCNKCKNEEINK